MRSLLSKWSLYADPDQVTQTVAEAFRVELLREVFRPHLSEKLLDIYTVQTLVSAPALEKVMNDPAAEFFADDPLIGRRVRIAAIEKAMGSAIRLLENKFGKNRAKWKWGRVHTLTYRSPYAQGNGLIAFLLARSFNVGPFPVGGSNTTLNVAFWTPDRWFDVAYGPGYRQIVDVGDMARSIYIPPAPGQSESSSSGFFRNLAKHAVSGSYLPMRWLRAQVAEDNTAELKLIP